MEIWRVILLSFLFYQGNSLKTHSREIDLHINFAYDVHEFLAKRNNTISLACNDGLSHYIGELLLGELWAIKMYDAGENLPSGLLEGNVVGLGSFDQCLSIAAETTTPTHVFGKYCIATVPNDFLLMSQLNLEMFKMSKPRVATPDGKTGIQLATCMPHVCSASEMEEVYTAIGLRRTFYEELCQTKGTQPKIETAGIATMLFLGAILLIMLISTIYDIFLYYSEKKPSHPLLIAFSILTNGRELIKTNKSASNISCLDGIRVIATIWIILGHTYSIRLHLPTKNSYYIKEWLNNSTNMFIMGATVCVDSFFLITGLLISFSFMNGVEKQARFNVILYYLHRYLRLAPVLTVIMLIHVTLLEHMGSGPIWPTVINRELVNACEKYWWKTLLFIQNYGSQEYMCVPQSWYLCVDMQLFVLSPLLLFPLKRWPKTTVSVTGFLTIGSMIYSFLIGWFFEFNMNILGNSHPKKRQDFGDYYYFATLSRGGPWLLGIILGYLIFKTKQMKTKLIINKKIVLSLWIVSMIVLCTCVLTGHDLIFGEHDKLRNSLHLALVRPAWSIGLGWIIFACVSGYGGRSTALTYCRDPQNLGPVNWFLSLPLFQIVSRLTFTLYLVHFTVIHVIVAQIRTPSVRGNFHEMHTFWGDLAFSFIVSVILALTIESPVIAIEKIVFNFPEKSVKIAPKRKIDEIPQGVLKDMSVEYKNCK